MVLKSYRTTKEEVEKMIEFGINVRQKLEKKDFYVIFKRIFERGSLVCRNIWEAVQKCDNQDDAIEYYYSIVHKQSERKMELQRAAKDKDRENQEIIPENEQKTLEFAPEFPQWHKMGCAWGVLMPDGTLRPEIFNFKSKEEADELEATGCKLVLILDLSKKF